MKDVKEMKLELSTKKLFGDLEIECYVDSSIENGNFFMTRRQIGEALEYKTEKQMNVLIFRHKDDIGDVLREKIPVKEPNGLIKYYECELYNTEQILKLISLTQQPKTNILIKYLSQILGYAPVKIKNRYEIDFENILFTTFKDVFHIKKQYNIKGYFLDWYIPQYNIIIECDENNHNNYNKDEEKTRTDYINKKLNNPIWIRFNPNDKNFNIGNILNKILKNIVGFRMKSTD